MIAVRHAKLALGVVAALSLAVRAAVAAPAATEPPEPGPAPASSATPSSLPAQAIAGPPADVSSSQINKAPINKEPPACAAQSELLGLSRIVEIDTSTAPRFGDQYSHRNETQFLEDHEVILTFDDGPLHRYTKPILDALDAQCTRATFFSVGRMAIADPAMLQEISKRGHTIATHTWSHKNLAKVDEATLKYEIELGLSAVVKAAGDRPVAPFFRFPYLSDPKAGLAYLKSRELGIFGIHVDSSDFRTRNPAVVLANVMKQLQHEKKGIILFHDIQPSTAGAITKLLAELKTAGFKVVHVVPNGAPKTLPEFDAIAEKALRAKTVAAVSDPLTARAVTWPVSSGQPPADGTGSEPLPWTKPAEPAGAAADPAPPTPPKPQQRAAKKAALRPAALPADEIRAHLKGSPD